MISWSVQSKWQGNLNPPKKFCVNYIYEEKCCFKYYEIFNLILNILLQFQDLLAASSISGEKERYLEREKTKGR